MRVRLRLLFIMDDDDWVVAVIIANITTNERCGCRYSWPFIPPARHAFTSFHFLFFPSSLHVLVTRLHDCMVSSFFFTALTSLSTRHPAVIFILITPSPFRPSYLTPWHILIPFVIYTLRSMVSHWCPAFLRFPSFALLFDLVS